MISVNNLSFTYATAPEPAVSGIEFGVERGEIFGFLGPSGAGKSTTQRVLIGLLKDFEGQIDVLGQSVSSWGADYYERIGVSFEVPNLYQKLSGTENLTYFGSLYGGETLSPEALLEMVGLEADGDMLVSQYSKGMRNRLNVARALIHQPELLFMDEPTAGLDPVNALRIKGLIREQQAQGRTVFLTTHDMTVADQLCDRVAFIIDGQIRLIDSPRSLKLQHGSQRVRVEYRQNGSTAGQDFDLSGLGENGDFLQLLKQQEVETIHTQEATLEDIFIQVTGRSLAEEV
jgi:fluoroquinolone transport system ATP-binding protein